MKKYWIQISNLPYGCDKKELYLYFRQICRVVDIFQPRSEITGRYNRCCYIAFGDLELAEVLVKATNK